MGSEEHHAINRLFWDGLAAVHGQDDVYDSRALVGGQSSLAEEEECALRAAVGDVAGLDVLHVQCHIGFDAVTFARRGARVTGVDFSEAALAKARALAEQCGVEVDWVAADATVLPFALHGRFDLVWATFGVLCWIADLQAWMGSVAATLSPGGQLVLIDGHPLAKMVSSTDPPVLSLPYGGGAPQRFEDSVSYANVAAPGRPCAEFAYSLGEIVTAAARAGLVVAELIEHLDVSFDHRSGHVNREADGRYRLRVGGEVLPTLFTLRAGRPPSRASATRVASVPSPQASQPSRLIRARRAIPSLREAWEANASSFTAWARAPTHDSYWRFHRDQFLEILPPPGCLTVDIGCGEGRLSRDLKARGHQVVGVDSSPTMIENARQADPLIEVHQADAASLPLGDAVADLAIAFMSLQDMDNMPAAIIEAARVLKRGGRLCVAIIHPLNSAGTFAGEDGDSPFVISESYLDSFRYVDEIERGGLSVTMASEHRPLEAYFRALTTAEFLVERLREPAMPEAAIRRPRQRRWQRVPMFLHFRAVRA